MKLSYKNISLPYPGVFQVRVVRRKIEHSRTFPFKAWGGEKKALKAANTWRDQLKLVISRTGKRSDWVPVRNTSSGVLGVSRIVKTEKPSGRKHLVFGVNWKDSKGQYRIKTFRVGNVDSYTEKMEQRARQAAIAFRSEWEELSGSGQIERFDSKKYTQWRELF